MSDWKTLEPSTAIKYLKYELLVLIVFSVVAYTFDVGYQK